MLISPFVAFFCSSILSAILVYDAVQIAAGTFERDVYTSGRNQILREMVEGLARMLGPIPSIGLSALLVVPSLAWFVVVYRRYRVIVAADRAAAIRPG